MPQKKLFITPYQFLIKVAKETAEKIGCHWTEVAVIPKSHCVNWTIERYMKLYGTASRRANSTFNIYIPLEEGERAKVRRPNGRKLRLHTGYDFSCFAMSQDQRERYGVTINEETTERISYSLPEE